MADITTPVQVVVGEPVTASDHNTSADAITELTSALETIENSQLINGSFEQPLAGTWVASDVGNGSHSIETTTVIDGVQSFKAVATAAGGYVDLDSDEFLYVAAEIDDVFLDGRIYVTGQVNVKAWIEWFDVDDISIGTQQIMNYTFGAGELNAWHRMRGYGRAVATARSYKVTFQLGDGTVIGDIFLDGITTRLNNPYPWIIESTAVLIHSTNLSSALVSGAVIGIAHALCVYYVDNASANVSDEMMWDRDAGAWVSTVTNAAISSSAVSDNNAYHKRVAGLITNASGQYQVIRAGGGGGVDIYRSMWR